MWREFKGFILRENVLALAVAVVLGAAVSKVVTAVVDDLIMPIVGAVVPITRPCPYCRLSVDPQATRCPHCTSDLASAVSS